VASDESDHACLHSQLLQRHDRVIALLLLLEQPRGLVLYCCYLSLIFLSLNLLSHTHTTSTTQLQQSHTALHTNHTKPNTPTHPAAMDSGRKDLGDKISDKATPQDSKSTLDKVSIVPSQYLLNFC
jgi:hypothetical protein